MRVQGSYCTVSINYINLYCNPLACTEERFKKVYLHYRQNSINTNMHITNKNPSFINTCHGNKLHYLKKICMR